MTTIVTDSPEEAASFIRSGETAAFPTETVYGLGADAFDAQAVRKIFLSKGRPEDNPLIVHIGDRAQIELVALNVPESAKRLLAGFFPGPLTLVLPKQADLPDVVTAGLSTVGVRMPRHPIAQAFLTSCGGPVAAPSANRSGRPSPTSWQAVLEDLGGRIPCVLKGGRSPVGLESTVVDCTTEPPIVLRAGAVSLDELRAAAPEVAGPPASRPETARSPGMRHRHYAPSARVELVDEAPAAPPDRAAYIGLQAPSNHDSYRMIQRAATVEEYAHELFDFMRRCDAEGIDVIYCQGVEPVGLGLAIMDRLRRASEAHTAS